MCTDLRKEIDQLGLVVWGWAEARKLTAIGIVKADVSIFVPANDDAFNPTARSCRPTNDAFVF